MNTYVDFVSDEVFLDCTKWVCDAYPEDADQINMQELQRNVLDPFKLIFDITNQGVDMPSWIKTEQIRQRDKTINNRIGEFHQKLLGNVEGWVDLGVGDDTRVDLKKEDDSIFVELKNKYNTMNADASNSCRDKLEQAVTNYPECTAYWAYLIGNNGTSGDCVWQKKGREINNRIRKIWGWRVYELITGDHDSLKNTWSALPLAISDLLEQELICRDVDETRILNSFYNSAFH